MDTLSPPEETYRGWLHRVPEYLSGMVLGALLVITWQGAQTLPPRVPMHFNWAGQPDRWGTKLEFYLICLMGVVVYAGFWLGQWLVERTGRVAWPGRHKLTPAQATVVGGMLRWLKLQTVALMAYAAWSIVQVGTGAATGMNNAVPLTLTLLIFATVGFFMVWLARAK